MRVPYRPVFLRQLGADWALGSVTLLLFALGATWGLRVAPPDRMMGDVYRILFVHVPSAWLALVAYTVTLVASVMYLWRGTYFWDAVAESSAELGVVFNCLLLVTGSIWGKPTWGVWWTWDPRLTTAAIMCFAFIGYLALRALVVDVARRATWSAVCAVLIYADIPLVEHAAPDAIEPGDHGAADGGGPAPERLRLFVAVLVDDAASGALGECAASSSL